MSLLRRIYLKQQNPHDVAPLRVRITPYLICRLLHIRALRQLSLFGRISRQKIDSSFNYFFVGQRVSSSHKIILDEDPSCL